MADMPRGAVRSAHIAAWWHTRRRKPLRIAKVQSMTEQFKSGETAVARLFTRAWRALVTPGANPKPTLASGPPRLSDIHPPGSCARTSRPPDFSDLFAPETPRADEKRR